MNTIIIDTDKINSTVKILTEIAEELANYNRDIDNSLSVLANAWVGEDANNFIYSMRNYALFNSQKIRGKIVYYNQALTNIVRYYDELDTTFADKSCSL